MLAQLTISNFAIVRELEIDFHSGMTAIRAAIALKPKGQDFRIDRPGAAPAVLRTMSTTGG